MFIKYGAEGHLRALMEQGQMYMNPCKYFRDLEASQLLKGIGDCNDGGIITDEGKVVLKHRNGRFQIKVLLLLLSRAYIFPYFA